LKGNARGFPDEIDGVQQVLDVQQTKVPGPLLPADYLRKGRGRRPVPSAGVNVDKIDRAPRVAKPPLGGVFLPTAAGAPRGLVPERPSVALHR
jgi:hypothetical protein